MKISVLIANYNNGQYFSDCWQSLLKQTEQDFEVVIVDDASTDNSVEIIKELTQSDNRVKFYLNEKNQGCGYTKHRCAINATATITAYLDPDDTIEPLALEEMLKIHSKHPNASVVHSRFCLVDMDLSEIELGKQGEQIPEGQTYLTYGKGAITAFASFKMKAYKQSGGIDPKFKRAVDQDLYYKLEEHGPTIYLDKVLYNYRVTPTSISNNDSKYKAEYWHILAMKDAVGRRGINSSSKFVFRLMQKEFEHFKVRMNNASRNKSWCKRYYFLYKLYTINFRYKLRAKIKCLFSPSLILE